MVLTLMVFVLSAVIWICAYHRLPAIVWTISVAFVLGLISLFVALPHFALALLWGAFAVLGLLLSPTVLRRQLVAKPLLALFRKILPHVSTTEQEALDAGTVWWDGDLFSGNPDWKKMLAFPKPTLSAEEQAFVDGPVEELCGMINDWQITKELYDLPPHVWQFIKDHGFLGMIIPKQHGGMGFSALAHSEVVMKLSTRSVSAAVSVMVPNSLGPAELLLHYGTDAQKNYYLPRLAKGVEMPCFALTSPSAGSDAGGIPDFGIVCRGTWDGKPDVLGIRLTWEKRYITLGPIATLLGLAFRLFDPDHLLGSERDVGITLALIPTATEGVHIGRRHLPMNAMFMNGPNWGKDVFIPMDYIIGGIDYVGQGWKMLMNCLAAGRSISLPASSVGSAKLCSLTTGAYARVRTQFNMPVGKFEGVEDAIARIGGQAYIMDAARVMTAGALDLGEKPSVISAIVKYHLTERARLVINDAMDVHAGKGICMGPNNYLANAYQSMPIGITVEGANILTRAMIIFGQGALRGHPYILKEIAATKESDPQRALVSFDAALFGHIAFVVSNFARALWLGITRGSGVSVPGDVHTRRYYQQLTRFSSAFALTADVAIGILGGALKRREQLSARLGDILSALYMASAALKRYEDSGRPSDDLPLLHWALQDTLNKIRQGFYGLFLNLPSRFAASVLRNVIFPHGNEFGPPPDVLGLKISQMLQAPGPARDRLIKGAYVSKNSADPIATLEAALRAVIAAEPVEAKLRAAIKAGTISGEFGSDAVGQALAQGIVSQEEAQMFKHAQALRRQVIMVDDFPRDFGKSEITQSTEAVSFEALAGR